MANANSPISAISPISPNGPTQPYMTMPPPPQNQPPRSTGNTPHNRKVSPMGNRNHNPHMNQWGPPQHPLQQNHNPNAIYNPQQHMYNNNPSLTNNQFPNHNATGTMIQHMNQGTHPDVPNLYDDRSSGSNNVIPNSTSHPTSLHQGATLYQSRSECVWSIHLFEQTEVASKFQCETCRDVPRKGFAFTSDQQTGVYCEYCIDLKVRQGMDIQHKTRLPIMVQNMIDKLKVKCPRYAQCKHKGTVHGLVEHLKVCNQIKGKKKSGAQAKQCPLEYMGCVEFTGGYLKEHYDEYQQEHFDFVIAFFENKLHKFETQLTMKLTETQTEIAQLKAENVELKNEIVTLNTAKEHLSSELVDIRQSLSEMKQQQSVVIHAPVQIEENNPYKIVVNEAAKEAHSKQSQHTQNSDREHGNWNSFLNAHRRLSTKTGATIPDTQQTENAAAGAGAMVHGNYAGQLLSNPQSFNTQQSSSYASSMRSETASEGWFHKLPNHPLLNELGKQSNHNNSNNNRSKLQQNIGSAASEERVMKPNRNLQQQQSHCTGDTHTEHRYEEEDIHDDDDETLMDDTFDDEATHTTAATDTTSVRNERIMAKIKDMKKKGRIKSSAEFQYIQIAKINNKKKKKKKKKNDNNIHRHQHKHPDNTSHDDTPLRSSEITHHGVKQQTNTCPPTASTPKESNTSRAPLPSNTNTNLSTPHTMPPPPSFLPSFPIQQPPTRTALSSSHLPTIGAMPLPPPPYPYTHGPYANPHISYTHYNPQFYYMHTTYNYAPPKPTKTINPKLIKKQRIDNKSCEVIDLSDDRSPTVTNYQYAPYPTAIPGMPMAPMPMPMPHFPLIPTAPHPMMQLQHPIKPALLTPPPAMVPSLSNHESSSSVSSVATHSSLSTPTNIDREESEYKTMKRKVVSDKQNVRKKGGKVVNNNIQIKRKHVDLFESLLTPKATSNSSINSSIIHRALQQEESNTEYQKLDNHNKKSKGKKGKKRRKPPPHNPYMVPIHAYAPHPFPLPTQMIPIPMMPPHLPPMIVPNMTMPHIGMTPFVLAPRRMEHTEKEMDVDALFGEMQRDLKVNEEYCDRMPVLQVQLRQSSEEDEDEKRRKRKKKKKKRKKHKKKRKKHHKKKGKKKTIKSENITLDSEMNNDEIKMNEAMSNGTMSDANVMSGYPPHPHHPNMFSNFNVSPPNPCNFNIHRSASPPFGLSDDDLYCGSLPFRSPEFGGTAFYENDSPLMPVDIDRHSPPPSYS
eukprot:814271_1